MDLWVDYKTPVILYFIETSVFFLLFLTRHFIHNITNTRTFQNNFNLKSDFNQCLTVLRNNNIPKLYNRQLFLFLNKKKKTVKTNLFSSNSCDNIWWLLFPLNLIRYLSYNARSELVLINFRFISVYIVLQIFVF